MLLSLKDSFNKPQKDREAGSRVVRELLGDDGDEQQQRWRASSLLRAAGQHDDNQHHLFGLDDVDDYVCP